MGLDLGKATNKGTAMLKFAHQFQPDAILKDDYVGYFFDDSIAQSLKEDCLNLGKEPTDEVQRFQQIAYWYIILREKYGDDVIENAIAAGCKQLLLLGSGYDTRFFRLATVQKHDIATFEVDLPATIADKQQCLMEKRGEIPPGLTLIPLDFNQDDLHSLVRYGFDPTLPTAYVWQGVSYYLPQASVAQVLAFIQSQMTPDSVFVFDCCSPLMTFKNDQIPGVAASVERLQEIGEPYLFGMEGSDMKAWLEAQGFQGVEVWQQDDLEARYLQRRTLPNNMWYVVAAQV